MKTFRDLIHDCGLRLDGYARLNSKNEEEFNRVYSRVRKWSCGDRAPDPKAVEKLTELSAEVKRIFK